MAKRLNITCREKEHLYLLVTILENLINYRGSIINIEIGLVTIKIKGRMIIINFNILLLGKDKAVLGML